MMATASIEHSLNLFLDAAHSVGVTDDQPF